MTNFKSKQHNIALLMLSSTALVWGAGFLLSDLLLQNGFGDIPFSLNALRFGVASLILIALFCTKIRLNKQLLLFGVIGGVLLCGGFGLQLIGLKYTTPASCGFFTASYTLFVPFIVWIFRKKRPSLLVSIGIGLALVGLILLNLPTTNAMQGNDLLGNMLTLCGSLFFAAQIVLADFALNTKKVDPVSMTVVQVCACAVTFALIAVAFESKNYATVTINWDNCWWALAIVSLLGTSFAYFSQTFAQNHLSPTETSIIIACESPIGAVLSVAIGFEQLSWQLCVGGFFVLLAVVFVEVLPNVWVRNVPSKQTEAQPAEQDDSLQQTDNPD